MPRVAVLFYREEDGTIPLLEWLDGIPRKALVKCQAQITRLREHGHELRRPAVDYLRDDIYELRVGLQGINYRILYFFFGRTAVVLSHGLTKERKVPSRDIDKAIERKRKFEANPDAHTQGK